MRVHQGAQLASGERDLHVVTVAGDRQLGRILHVRIGVGQQVGHVIRA